jgi:hypothetical protein
MRAPTTLASAVVAAVVHAAATTHAAVASPPPCPTAGLVVWLDTRGDGAAGSIYYSLELTNLWGRPCTLAGYPGVSAVDLRRRQLGSAASRNPARPPHVVTLAPGASATSVLQVAQALNFPRSACRPTEAAGLRVYPPNQRTARIVPFPFRACSRVGPVYLTTQAVRRA